MQLHLEGLLLRSLHALRCLQQGGLQFLLGAAVVVPAGQRGQAFFQSFTGVQKGCGAAKQRRAVVIESIQALFRSPARGLGAGGKIAQVGIRIVRVIRQGVQ